MSRKKSTSGTCVFCGRRLSRGGMSRHLKSCAARQQAIEQANRKRGKPQQIFHLLVSDRYLGDFWLHLEMNGTARLSTLDNYLRAIWLECCGHLSMFTYGGWDDEIPKSRRAGQVFAPGVQIVHYYDFGTTSETVIKVVDVRQGQPLSRHPIFLMARNEMPEVVCQECEQPAAFLCMECIIEDEEPGWLCEQHAENHPHEDYGEPIPVVNSPRLGMCGYDGPAEPPY